MKKGTNTFIVRLLKGFIIGIAAILPGASGGVLAVSMGIYHPIIEAITSVFRSFKKSVRYLLPLGTGGVIGLFATSRLLELLLNVEGATDPIMYTLIGMVAGGVPSFMRDANAHGFKKRYLFGTVAGLIVIALFAYLEHALSNGEPWPVNAVSALVAGAIIAVGTIIPGISTSFLLIYLGLYKPLLSAFNSFDISILFFVGLGFAAMGALLILFVKRMFDRHYGYSYYAVLGFLAGSVALIFPPVTFSWTQLLYTALMAAGFVATFLLCKAPREAAVPDAKLGDNAENENSD